MKLIINKLCLCLLFSVPFFTPLSGQVLEEHVIKDLKVVGDNRIGHIDTGSHDIELRISPNHEESTSGFFISCLGSMGSSYGSLRLGQEGYIDVINHSGSRISAVEYVGCSTSQADASNCLAGVSLDGVSYQAYYKERSKPATNITSGLSFSGDTENACRGYRILIPDTVYHGLGGSSREIPGFQSQVKVIRLIWTSGSFAGKSNSSMGEVPEFYGFKISTVIDTSVGLEEGRDPSPVTVKKDMYGSYRLSEECDITIYDLSGRLILKKQQASVFSLAGEPGGVYLLRGIINDSKQSFQQKLIVQ